FVVGIVLGKLYLLDAHQRDDRKLKGAILSIGALSAIVAVMLVSESIPYLMLHNGFTSPLFFVMLYGLALGGGPLNCLLSWPFGVLLGDATYAMYILHTAIIAYTVVAVVDTIKKGETPMSPMTFFFFSLIASTLLAIWIYRKFEIPWRRKIRKFF